tara:strand:+ start:1471 stop:2187 length:717 start_codon:yes stop_codon:yes gene_type:complete
MINKEVNKSFFEHLDELRSRIIKSFLSIFLFSVFFYFLSDKIIEFLINPVNIQNVSFQVLKITSIFTIKIGISLVSGILVSIPFILYQIFMFIVPALNGNINVLGIFLSVVIYILFIIIGLCFGYLVLIPISIAFFTSLSIDLPLIEINYTLENYLVYVVWILIISSMVFQLPFLIILFNKLGVVKRKTLQRYRKHAVVLFFILGAFFTPPDPISQIIVVLPLYLLFELSIFITKFNK